MKPIPRHLKRIFKLLASMVGAGVLLACQPAGDASTSDLLFTGCCDASTAVAIDGNRFIVANDEDNLLRVYNRARPGPPVDSVDFSAFLGLKKSDESDLEGSARIGDTIFWITSHGRNKAGKDRPARRKFFATRLELTGDSVRLVSTGTVREDLLERLVADSRFAAFNLEEAAGRAPKDDDAFNIEGMAATETGGLLIGLRNPIPQGRALVFELKNPLAYTAGEPAEIGAPQLLDLQGLGVRSLTRHGSAYRIIAGSHDGADLFRMYEWTPDGDAPAWLPQVDLQGLNPEGISFPTEGGDEFLLVSDDGSRKVGDVDCKELKNADAQHFRARILRDGPSA